MDRTQISHLEPINLLSVDRQQEIARLCIVEKVSKDIDPFRMNIMQNQQSLYLLKGELEVFFVDNTSIRLKGGTRPACYPVGGSRKKLTAAKALSEIDIVRIDSELMDIMMTWDQLASYEQSPESKFSELVSKKQWMKNPEIFSAEKIQRGALSRLPAASIDTLFQRMERVDVVADQVIITQGMEGDYYYLIDSGRARVTRVNDVTTQPALLAELGPGDAFGEDALVSDNKRNATVTMSSDGVLMRLSKKDFVELLKEPLLNQISIAEALDKVSSGAIWLDTRFPQEYKFDAFSGAINIPLHEIREGLSTLSRDKTYVCYCHTGRRSSAAAFILAQQGFDAYLLDGGLRQHNGIFGPR